MKVESQVPVTTAPSSDKSRVEGRKSYREDQGRLARMAAFWSCILLLLFGCTFVYGLLVQIDSFREKIGGMRIPVVGVDLTTAFLIPFALFVVGALILHRWQARPKVADLLIETEAELRKVTWPTPQEVVNSSMVVILCVLLLFGFLAAADWLLARVMRYLLLGGV